MYSVVDKQPNSIYYLIYFLATKNKLPNLTIQIDGI